MTTSTLAGQEGGLYQFSFINQFINQSTFLCKALKSHPVASLFFGWFWSCGLNVLARRSETVQTFSSCSLLFIHSFIWFCVKKNLQRKKKVLFSFVLFFSYCSDRLGKFSHPLCLFCRGLPCAWRRRCLIAPRQTETSCEKFSGKVLRK